MNTALFDATLQQSRQLLSDGRGMEAAAVARAQLARFPQDGRLIQLVGLAWHAEGRLRAARYALETALFLSPLLPESLLALAEAYVATKRPRDAHTSLKLLVERTDAAAELLPRAAALFGRLGDYTSALSLCRRSIALDPDCDEALFGAAFYMGRLGFPFEMAAASLRRALQLDPECCLYRRTLASLLTAMNELGEAYELYRSIPPEHVCCRGCLQTMITVFESFGDDARRDACALRLDRLAEYGSAASTAAENPSIDERK